MLLKLLISKYIIVVVGTGDGLDESNFVRWKFQYNGKVLESLPWKIDFMTPILYIYIYIYMIFFLNWFHDSNYIYIYIYIYDFFPQWLTCRKNAKNILSEVLLIKNEILPLNLLYFIYLLSTYFYHLVRFAKINHFSIYPFKETVNKATVLD